MIHASIDTTRRGLIQAGGLLFGAVTTGWLPAVGRPADDARSSFLLVDTRFPDTAGLMRRACGTANACAAVHGDVTDLWRTSLQQICSSGAWRVSGITTESVFFCLQQLAGPRGSVATDHRRITRDLFEWTLEGRPIGFNGASA